MRVTDPHDLSRTRPGFMRGAQAICSLAGIAWVAALVALFLVQQKVSYTVCSGTLLQFPPPSVHWPPEGHNLGLISLQHEVTLAAMGATIIGIFLVLYATEGMPVFRRTGWFLGGIATSLMLGAILWIAGEYYVLHAHLDAIGSCL